MVKLTGPMLSLSASGTLGQTITYSTNRGRSYAKRHTKPIDPKSAPQISLRAMMKWLTQIWTTLDQAHKDTWTNLALMESTSSYNAFLQYNMREWSNFLPPTRSYPTDRNAVEAAMAVTAANWVEHRIKIDYQAFVANDGWGLMVFASQDNGFSTAAGNLLTPIKLEDLLAHSYYFTPSTRTTWYINSRSFTIDGRQGAELGQLIATP